jgi:hypothetical protein
VPAPGVPYYAALFPPHPVTPWIAWKISSTSYSIARRFWEQREDMRRAYEAVSGRDASAWAFRHPGVVLDAGRCYVHAACLGCLWLHARGHYVPHRDYRSAGFGPNRSTNLELAHRQAHRHQYSDGSYVGQCLGYQP